MSLRSAVILLLFGSVGYFGLGYLRTHTSGEVIAYKAFSRAVIRGDITTARRLAANPEVLRVFDFQDRRMGRYRGEIKFTYFQVLEQHASEDGDRVTMRVRQVIRLNPRGTQPSIIGRDQVDEIHNVVMERGHNGVWRVASFRDSFAAVDFHSVAARRG